MSEHDVTCRKYATFLYSENWIMIVWSSWLINDENVFAKVMVFVTKTKNRLIFKPFSVAFIHKCSKIVLSHYIVTSSFSGAKNAVNFTKSNWSAYKYWLHYIKMKTFQ